MRTRASKALFSLLLASSLTACSSTPEPRPAPRESFREGKGRTIVMLGGGVYGAAMFAPHARSLSREFDVIRIQTLNVQSASTGAPLPADYSISQEAEAVHQTLRSLGVGGPVDLIGSSLGAVVALRLATLHPERARTLILFEPPAFWTLSPEDLAADATAHGIVDLTSRMGPEALPTDDDFKQFRCLLGSCPPDIPAAGDPARPEWDRSRMSMRGLAAVSRHREDPGALRELRTPILLLAGSDTVPFHRRINERLALALPKPETAVLPGNHTALRTSSTEFLNLVRDFLSRH